jgi:hypothetical protein
MSLKQVFNGGELDTTEHILLFKFELMGIKGRVLKVVVIS